VTELLTLDTIAKRDTISIKSKKYPAGKVYELANAADFGPIEWALMVRRSEEAQALLAKKRATKKDGQRGQDIIDEFVKLVVHGIEPATLLELTPQQRQSIYFTWLVKITGAAEGNSRAPKRAPSRSTGSK